MPYAGPSSTTASHVIGESEHLGLLDVLCLHRGLQQSDDEDDEHNELLHLGMLIMTGIREMHSGDKTVRDRIDLLS